MVASLSDIPQIEEWIDGMILSLKPLNFLKQILQNPRVINEKKLLILPQYNGGLLRFLFLHSLLLFWLLELVVTSNPSWPLVIN